MTEEALLPLSTGTSSFERLREANQLYVDKTALVCELAAQGGKFFLTRPRRFGKSLLLNTFASLFSSGLKYFSGLAAERLWKDKLYSVARIDFSEIKNVAGLADFERQLDEVLENAFQPLGFHRSHASSMSLVKQLSAWMRTLPANSMVLLIDEYDAPQAACLEDKRLFNAIRMRLAAFYAVIKSNDACLRFVFITGIAKFNQTGIFSELNDFTDISLNPAFGTLLGYSEADIEHCFSGYLDRAARALGLSREAVLGRLRESYDGYCFDEKASTHVYALWSVMKFLAWPDLGFANYWMESGGALDAAAEISAFACLEVAIEI